MARLVLRFTITRPVLGPLTGTWSPPVGSCLPVAVVKLGAVRPLPLLSRVLVLGFSDKPSVQPEWFSEAGMWTFLYQSGDETVLLQTEGRGQVSVLFVFTVVPGLAPLHCH